MVLMYMACFIIYMYHPLLEVDEQVCSHCGGRSSCNPVRWYRIASFGSDLV